MRITPAYAGKRSNRIWKGITCGDHPRVCGEKISPTDEMEMMEGSPPRMRGKVVNGLKDGDDAGITPAYAGKRGSNLAMAT